MPKTFFLKATAVAMALGLTTACAPDIVTRDAGRATPASYYGSANAQDTTNVASTNWQTYFADPNLTTLIGQALQNNQELNITLQEIEISRQEIRARKGDYLPFLGIQAGAGADLLPRYTLLGATERSVEIKPGKEVPRPLPNLAIGAVANWEVDIWHKLRNARKAAALRYLSGQEGRNFLVTNLVSDIAESYYRLLALDAQLALVRRNISIQTNAFGIVRAQKEAARVTELAVRRFEAQVLRTRSLQFDLQQQIIETENRINFLVGRYSQPVVRTQQTFEAPLSDSVASGIPAQLLLNRPDVRRAEADLAAAKLDVRVAKAYFYPTLSLTAAAGYQAFTPGLLFSTPESMALSAAGSILQPLVNRNGLKAAYYSANARQMQAVFNYERAVLNAYTEVSNQVNRIRNLQSSYALRRLQVDALNQSSDIANNLFNSARADYMEVLLTQRDALEASIELVDTRLDQLQARVQIYRALGGGWR